MNESSWLERTGSLPRPWTTAVMIFALCPEPCALCPECRPRTLSLVFFLLLEHLIPQNALVESALNLGDNLPEDGSLFHARVSSDVRALAVHPCGHVYFIDGQRLRQLVLSEGMLCLSLFCSSNRVSRSDRVSRLGPSLSQDGHSAQIPSVQREPLCLKGLNPRPTLEVVAQGLGDTIINSSATAPVALPVVDRPKEEVVPLSKYKKLEAQLRVAEAEIASLKRHHRSSLPNSSSSSSSSSSS
jgi:hypothetical protein